MQSNTNKVKAKSVIMYMLTALFLLYVMALQVYPSVITKQLMVDFSIKAAGLGLISGFFYYTYTLMQIPAGLLFNRFEPRVLVAITLLICAFGVGLFGVAHSIFLASIARLIMGLGSAFGFISVLVISARYFPKKHFALLIGVAQVLASAGAFSGIMVLDLIVGILNWRGTMFIAMSIGIVLAIAAFFCFVEKTNSIEVDLNFKVIIEKFLQILKKKQSWYVALYAFMSWVPITAFAALWGVPFLKVAYGFSIETASEFCSLIWVGVALGSLFCSLLSAYIGNRKILLSCIAIMGFVCMSILLFDITLPHNVLALILILLGVAASGQILTFAIVKDNTEASMEPAAIGLNNMAIVITGAVFQPMLGLLLQFHPFSVKIHSTISYSLADYQYALSILLASYVCCFLLSSFFIKDACCNSDKLSFCLCKSNEI